MTIIADSGAWVLLERTHVWIDVVGWLTGELRRLASNIRTRRAPNYVESREVLVRRREVGDRAGLGDEVLDQEKEEGLDAAYWLSKCCCAFTLVLSIVSIPMRKGRGQ